MAVRPQIPYFEDLQYPSTLIRGGARDRAGIGPGQRLQDPAVAMLEAVLLTDLPHPGSWRPTSFSRYPAATGRDAPLEESGRPRSREKRQ
jgi:hypothetical protein